MDQVRRDEPAIRQLSREEQCSSVAERSDTDGSFNAFGNAPSLPLRTEGMTCRVVTSKEEVRWTVTGSQRRSA